jgi:pimeloyl-ACP methyl ester carboxylesterase
MTPMIVLVHGAYADSTSWEGLLGLLPTDGRVVAFANPLRGLATDTALLTDLVKSLDGPVALVGHSYGGAVITGVPADAGDIVALVYVAGFALAPGESAPDHGRARGCPAERRDPGRVARRGHLALRRGREPGPRRGVGRANDVGGRAPGGPLTRGEGSIGAGPRTAGWPSLVGHRLSERGERLVHFHDVGGQHPARVRSEVEGVVRYPRRDEERGARGQEQRRSALDHHPHRSRDDVPHLLARVDVPAGLDAGRDLGQHLNDLAAGDRRR